MPSMAGERSHVTCPALHRQPEALAIAPETSKRFQGGLRAHAEVPCSRHRGVVICRAMSMSQTRDVLDAIWREQSPRLIAVLARMLGGDVGSAEELAQDTLVSALEHWPRDGIPDNPGAWLMAAGKRRAIDVLRQRSMQLRKHAGIAEDMEQVQAGNVLDVEALDDPVGDDLLRLVFVACHPVLSTEAQVALTLRLLGGLTTDEIARAFLVPESTVAQRIVRAKRVLAEKEVAYEVPRGEELHERLTAVLTVVYLIFNEGYAATSGNDWMRPSLCEDALRLARMLTLLVPQAPEVFGLRALLELQASRFKARVDADGQPIPLLEQDRSLWNTAQIASGLSALQHALTATGVPGPYTLQAAIAACHARASHAADTDWARITGLYDVMAEHHSTPVVELNRAFSVAMSEGPQAGLDLVDQLQADKSMQAYPLLPGVRGDLLEKLGRLDEASREFERAAQLTRNARERATFERRAAACRH